MHVGGTTARFKTTRPVMIWPMLPRSFAEGDVVSVALPHVNDELPVALLWTTGDLVAADKPAKPAKPKAVSKPAAKPKSTTGDAAPSDQKTAAPHS